MIRRVTWGSALIVIAAGSAWVDSTIETAYRAAAQKGLLLYAGVPADYIASWFRIAALLAGTIGILLLLPALIGRIQSNVLRRVIGWTTTVAAAAALPFLGIALVLTVMGAGGVGDIVKVTAANGQTVLITQDGFDGDAVAFYTEYDAFHYRRTLNAPELSGWPRVKDRNCQLDPAVGGLQLVCGDKTLMLGAEEGDG